MKLVLQLGMFGALTTAGCADTGRAPPPADHLIGTWIAGTGEVSVQVRGLRIIR